MPSVFISYRRTDSAALATLIAHQLEQIHAIDAYVDTRNADAGGSFPDRLRAAIERSDVFVCLLGTTTLQSDWVLIEIEHAHNLRKTMIPVFQERYVAPNPIPKEHVAALLNSDGVQFLDVRNLYIDESIARLAKMIQNSAPRPTATSKTPFYRHPAFIIGILALIVIISAVVVLPNLNPPQPTGTPVTNTILNPSDTFAPTLLNETVTPTITATSAPTLTPTYAPTIAVTNTSIPLTTLTLIPTLPSFFNVYTDAGALDNHFKPTGIMGDIGDIRINEVWPAHPQWVNRGNTVIRIVYDPQGQGDQKGNHICSLGQISNLICTWAGLYWQDPPNNDGSLCYGGFPLTGYKRLTFWAYSDSPLAVEFKIGGIGWGVPIRPPCPDSTPPISSGWQILGSSWQMISIPLTDVNLSYIIGGFEWDTNWPNNNIQQKGNPPFTFYLDDIRYEQ